MKILLIGGTGTISMAVSKLLLSQGHTLYLVNRGSRSHTLTGDIIELKADINEEASVSSLIKDLSFDVVADFIAFTKDQLARDYRLFQGKTRQFIYISSASAYQKPLSDYRINEGTPLANPYWEYSRNKIAGEDYLMELYRDSGFPVTIIRPSHTYCERSVPLGVHGTNGSYAVIKRMLEEKPVIIHGDTQPGFCKRLCRTYGKYSCHWRSCTDYLRRIPYLESDLSDYCRCFRCQAECCPCFLRVPGSLLSL